MADAMTKLVKEKVKKIRELEGIKPRDKDRTARVVEFVESHEVAYCSIPAERGYLAGYLRGVAEAADVTVGELLDEL